ncbi:DUF4433 domain-containing protein [Streptomyces sp. NPDC002935]|uniref:type II toxin-antitoxin system toxin DNA ADP-ribosyl transferase DarT n=1 Tax=Streptomyces sp. NPDC002935 TaxID=3154545 RepID=UPI0033B56A00
MTSTGDRQLFHFTHIRNLPGILNDKCLVSDSEMQSRGGVPMECGDTEIKSQRRLRPIKVSPGGVPADYVPFYYAPRSPMLYRISKGGVRTYPDGQPPLVYLVSNVAAASGVGQPYVVSDGNCASAITDHFNSLESMEQVVDWSIIGAQIWANTTNDGDRMRRRMAEFLVYEQLPVSALTEVATYDREHALLVERLLDDASVDLPVTVRREWYY